MFDIPPDFLGSVNFSVCNPSVTADAFQAVKKSSVLSLRGPAKGRGNLVQAATKKQEDERCGLPRRFAPRNDITEGVLPRRGGRAANGCVIAMTRMVEWINERAYVECRSAKSGGLREARPTQNLGPMRRARCLHRAACRHFRKGRYLTSCRKHARFSP